MMKSVFLSDSHVLDNAINETDNDYIIVHANATCSKDDLYQLDEELEEQDGHFMIDEEEYDYCDDAMSEGEQPQQGCFCLSPSLITEEMILEQTERPSIQRILDEAHESASQLKSLQLHQLDLISCSQSLHGDDDDDDQKQEEHEALASQPESVPGRLESSASDNSVLSGDYQNDQKHDNELAHVTMNQVIEESKPFTTTGTTYQVEVEMEDIDREDTPICASMKPHIGGRMSNKKRRKKMKLLKKAGAAAKAASALSTTEGPPDNTKSSSIVMGKDPSPTQSTGKPISSTAPSSTKVRPTSRYYSKRVANIAVACATETLASYKAEVGLKTGSYSLHFNCMIGREERETGFFTA